MTITIFKLRQKWGYTYCDLSKTTESKLGLKLQKLGAKEMMVIPWTNATPIGVSLNLSTARQIAKGR